MEKGLLQNARHFATAPFKNVFASTQANFGLYAPEAMICLMASFLNERFLRSGDAKHIAHINQIGIFQSVKPHKRRHRCAKSLGNLPERIAPADGIGFIPQQALSRVHVVSPPHKSGLDFLDH